MQVKGVATTVKPHRRQERHRNNLYDNNSIFIPPVLGSEEEKSFLFVFFFISSNNNSLIFIFPSPSPQSNAQKMRKLFSIQSLRRAPKQEKDPEMKKKVEELNSVFIRRVHRFFCATIHEQSLGWSTRWRQMAKSINKPRIFLFLMQIGNCWKSLESFAVW